jgi:hypothetical protein
MAKRFEAVTRSLLEKHPADWLDAFGLAHAAPVRVVNSDLSTVTAEADKVLWVEGADPGWSTSSCKPATTASSRSGCYDTMCS